MNNITLHVKSIDYEVHNNITLESQHLCNDYRDKWYHTREKQVKTQLNLHNSLNKLYAVVYFMLYKYTGFNSTCVQYIPILPQFVFVPFSPASIHSKIFPYI